MTAGVLVTAGVLTGCGATTGAGTPRAGGPSSATVKATVAATARQVDAVPGTSSTIPPACAAGWGSAARTAASTAVAPLVGVRAAQGPCSDRLVLEFAGPVDGYDVRYVPRVLADASGRPVPVAGGARLKVTLVAPAYGPAGSTFEPRDPAHVVAVAGFAAFRQVAWAGSFEGSTSLAVGVRAQLPFRVTTVAGPGAHSRLLLEVAHGR